VGGEQLALRLDRSGGLVGAVLRPGVAFPLSEVRGEAQLDADLVGRGDPPAFVRDEVPPPVAVEQRRVDPPHRAGGAAEHALVARHLAQQHLRVVGAQGVGLGHQEAPERGRS
jgi:hypothetical protein